MEQVKEGLLSPYRVIDLSDERGYLLGKFLADLGADVIKVEPPGGDDGRNRGPFFKDEPDREKNLFWFAYNLGKRGITLDLKKADGKVILKTLVNSADFVVESFAPGYLDSLGLGYKGLAEANRRIILVSVTGFGQEGPWRDFAACDLIISAMGGYQWLLGESDRAPVRIGFPITYHVACGWALAGALVAHYHRELAGEGQHVDCSAQECQPWFLNDSHLFWDISRVRQRRAGWGRIRPTTGFYIPEILPCKDGSVAFIILGGPQGAKTQRALVQWMDEEGMANEYLKTMDWESFDYGTLTKEILENTNEPIIRFFKTKTREELYTQAIKRRIMLYPASTVDTLLNSTQLKSRNFWVGVEHPQLGATLTHPGAWALLSESPMKTGSRAPFIGEHNEEVYQRELGFSNAKMVTLREAGII